MQPHRGRARPAVVNERNGALAQILHVAARVGGVIDQRGWFVLFVLQENRCRSRLVGNRLAAKLDDVICDRRFFLGRGSGGGFGGFLRRFGILVLCARSRGDRGHGQSKRQQHAQVFHADHRFSPRNKLVSRGSIKLRFYLFIRIHAEPGTILFDGR